MSSELTNSHLLISGGRGRGRRSLHASRLCLRGVHATFIIRILHRVRTELRFFQYNATLSTLSKNASDKVPPPPQHSTHPACFPAVKRRPRTRATSAGCSGSKTKFATHIHRMIKSLEFSAPGIHGESPARVRGHICHKIRGNRRRPPRVRPSPPGEGGFFAARHREVGRNLWSGPPARKFPGKKASPFFPDKNIFTAVETRDPKKRGGKLVNTFTFYLAAARKEKTAKRKKEKVFALAGARQIKKVEGTWPSEERGERKTRDLDSRLLPKLWCALLYFSSYPVGLVRPMSHIEVF